MRLHLNVAVRDGELQRWRKNVLDDAATLPLGASVVVAPGRPVRVCAVDLDLTVGRPRVVVLLANLNVPSHLAVVLENELRERGWERRTH